MAHKIYLSAALHAHDNPTKCPTKCGENVHCNQYMDIVQTGLVRCGFAVKRGDPAITGEKGCATRCKEANAWGAELYYVAHTNAGGGRYAVTYCWPDIASMNKCTTFGAFHKEVERWTHVKWRMKTTRELWEIRSPKCVTLYDELFFHDNAEDCKRFHEGGMQIIAEETVQGICAVFGVKYVAPGKPAEKPTEKPVEHKAGEELFLRDHALYVSSTAKDPVRKITGDYWIYDGKAVRGRYRITNRPDRVGKTPVGKNVTGWVVL